MSNPVVILVHGMGDFSAPRFRTHQRGSFGTDCISALNTALQFYPSLRTLSIEEKVNFVEIHYNHIFDTLRQEMADNGSTLRDWLQGAGATGALGKVPGFIQAALNFEASLGEDDFFYTHWLDVVLYKTYFGEFVRAHVARQLGEIIARNNALSIHILAHSLGTAVVHDTLSKVYGGAYEEEEEVAMLSPDTNKLASVWQIANVSRLANSVLPVADPYRSLVRPGAGGVTATMMNIHHKFDPFTWIRKFSRTNDGRWVPRNVYQRDYLDIETADITEVNTHSVKQYLLDPAVHAYLFKRLGIRIPSQKQYNDAVAAYRDMVGGNFQTLLQEKLNNVTRRGSGTFMDFFEAARGLSQAIKAAGGQP